jgi:hypothetical protein
MRAHHRSLKPVCCGRSTTSRQFLLQPTIMTPRTEGATAPLYEIGLEGGPPAARVSRQLGRPEMVK